MSGGKTRPGSGWGQDEEADGAWNPLRVLWTVLAEREGTDSPI